MAYPEDNRADPYRGADSSFFGHAFQRSFAETFDVVIRRLSNPYWKVFDLCFLVTILFHGFNGLWGIALEYIRSVRLLKFSQTVIVAMVSLLLVTGIYIITL